jgi:hypothetical protein
MAHFPQTTVRNHVQVHLRSSKHLHGTNALNSVAEVRRVSSNSIKRLQDIIAAQEDCVKKFQHQAVGTPAAARLLRISMKDSLLIYKHTLEQIRQSADLLEISWTMLE